MPPSGRPRADQRDVRDATNSMDVLSTSVTHHCQDKSTPDQSYERCQARGEMERRGRAGRRVRRPSDGREGARLVDILEICILCTCGRMARSERRGWGGGAAILGSPLLNHLLLIFYVFYAQELNTKNNQIFTYWDCTEDYLVR